MIETTLLFVFAQLVAQAAPLQEDVFFCGLTPTTLDPVWAEKGEEVVMTCTPGTPVCVGTSEGTCILVGPKEAVQEIGLAFTVGEAFCMHGGEGPTVMECANVQAD